TEHERIDGDDHVAAADQGGGGGTAAVVPFVVGGHGRMIAAQVDHFLLAEQKHAAVRVQIDNRRGRLLEIFRQEDVGRHAKVRRGGEEDLFAEVVAPVHALQHFRAGM